MAASRPPAIFIADAPALDFLNSIATPTDTQIEWIGDGEGLLAWLVQAHLAPPEQIRRLQSQAMPGELDSVAAQARSLREWFRDFVCQRMGRPLVAEDLAALAPLNRLLGRDDLFSQIVAHAHGNLAVELQPVRRWRSPESLLLPIGEALGKFVCEGNFSNVKQCEGDPCTLLFADHTRARARRWCSMEVCGNRAKQAAHRLRQKTKP
ncbi:CGNR zinc finger domain-containing protein [Rhodopila sp.]|uniref:CGNR zinc finger domain-containing protein n=1 Tax=Rhodopila sp. TaxID=2480087 RepID=UPI003D118C23